MEENAGIQEILVTRQPIFDKNKEVFAYELLFGSAFQEHARKRWSGNGAAGEEETDSRPGRKAAKSFKAFKDVDSFLLNGLKTLSGGKKAFITFNSDMLVTEFPLMFPSELLGVVVLERPETPEPMHRSLKKIKSAGYTLMLGDSALEYGEGVDPALVTLADIIGCDFRSKDLQQCRPTLKGLDMGEVKFLAKSVETATDYGVAEGKGYAYFQGDFFSKPDVVPVRSIPSYKVNLVKILKEINKPSVQFDRVEAILKKDVSITYKLLRFINSAKFGFKTPVQSIHHGLTLLGEMEVRKWLSLIVLSGTGTDKPLELIKNTIIRARFCESIAAELKLTVDLPKFFLMGMFSMVEAFLDRPLEEILVELPLAPAIKAALLGEDNRFRDVLDVVLDYERGDWRNFNQSAGRLRLDETRAVSLYLDSVEWAGLI
ncbi:MAG: HDOD domain-containing protein [bacterium]|nr:HDOD domain-containing protein [bacterium]